MKFKFNENLKLSTWFWHSINIIPLFETYSVCSDDSDYKIVGRVFAVTLFGLHVNMMVPTKKTHRMLTSPVLGPLYSRRRKQWYWPDRF